MGMPMTVSRPDLWQRFQRIQSCPCGLTLDFSRLDWPTGYPDSMSDQAREAIASMAALEGGSIANPDEKRQVGHYWLRTADLAPNQGVTDEIKATHEHIRSFAAAVHAGEIRPPKAERFSRLLVIGIGGSALGPQLAADALGTAIDPLKPYFLDNTDPDGFDRTFAALGEKLAATLAIVISKSGGTKETKNAMLETAWAMDHAGLKFGPQAVAVTEVGSPLDEQAKSEGWLKRFPMWDWVGGRTSQTGPVGLLPAALQGINIDGLLEGAREMDEATRSPEINDNPALLLALAWHHASKACGAKDMVVLPYKDRLLLLSRYLQQLVMESLGKELNLDGEVVHQGLAVYGNKGSTDQHSFLQQLRDGVPNAFVNFIEVQKDRESESREVEPGATSGDYLLGFLLGTREALYKKGRESITLTMPEITPRTFGAVIALYERAVGFYASLVHINAYHQPGVEAGKKAATRALELQFQAVAALSTAGVPSTADEVADRLGKPEAAETIYKMLLHLAMNERAVSVEAGKRPADALFRALG